MKNRIEDIKEEAVFMLKEKSTVRKVAEAFGVPKSTIHHDFSVKLKRIDIALYRKVRELLDLNKAERHIRGGMATRAKYKK